MPERLRRPRLEWLRQANAELRALAERAGAQYVSPLALVCGEPGCLVALGGQAAGMTTFDQSHLTPTGSKFVVDRLLQPYLK